MADFSTRAEDGVGNTICIDLAWDLVDLDITSAGGYRYLGTLRALLARLQQANEADARVDRLEHEVGRLGRLLHEARQDLCETGAQETKSSPIDFARGWYGQDLAEELFDNDNRRLPHGRLVEVDVITYDDDPPPEALRPEVRRV